ncbi:hypothetical protein Sliba_12820 [Streptomyces nigrescens]|uniref:Uncharacterized protein n=1 Tax=Streptomyces nigrescens TaxID=1920 RepID=A0A640TAR4_STRNI|nr:hypothetical protein Sliba_12820 [Streptomyces libani subsp. libani]GGV88263.1 hypothetical protein GCM10010500_10220 [Streptomyces libani subsp. libani]
MVRDRNRRVENIATVGGRRGAYWPDVASIRERECGQTESRVSVATAAVAARSGEGTEDAAIRVNVAK